MNLTDRQPPGVPCAVAAVERDPHAAARFYGELLGWKSESLMAADHPEAYIRCRLDGAEVAAIVSAGPAPAPPRSAWSTHVSVLSSDETARRAVAAGGTVVAEPFDSPGGGRVAVLADPDGAVFCTWEALTHGGAELVNAPGAWAMSQLLSDDLSRAAAFYAELFGWSTERFEVPGREVILFRLPGYVGGVPGQPVARDVVAAMRARDSGEVADDSPPAWSVDFWIDDATSAVERARRLGGGVIMEAHVVPPFTRVLLSDPEGAAFSLSQLMPAG